MKKWNLLAMVFVLSALLCLVDIGAAYSGGKMTDLGTLPGGTVSFAYSINNNGQIVGQSSTDSGQRHAFSYLGSTMTPLVTVPGWTFSLARGINNSGQIVGYGYGAHSTLNLAFKYLESTMTPLVNPPGGTFSLASGINDNGQIVGYADTTGGNYRAFS